MIKFGSARIDENGHARGGVRGDQTGCEVMEQPAYMHRNGWTGYRAKDPNVANSIAWWMKVACQSNRAGYNQDERYLIFFTNLDQLTNCDCSTLVPYCVLKSGINVNVDGIWTGNLGQRLLETGAFERFNVQSLEALCTGDVLVDGKGTSHTVVVTEGNSRQIENVFDVAEPTLSAGSQGEEVRKLQRFFDVYGSGCKIDGDYGFETFTMVCEFQRLHGLKVDGIYGWDTYSLVCFFLYVRKIQPV